MRIKSNIEKNSDFQREIIKKFKIGVLKELIKDEVPEEMWEELFTFFTSQ